MQVLDKNLLHYSDQLKYYALSLTMDNDDAKDLIQDTYYKAFRFKHQYLQNKNLKAWLFTIMKNTFINYYRRQTYRRKLMEEHQEERKAQLCHSFDEMSISGKMLRKDVMQAIYALDDKYEKPFSMFIKGYKYSEIAKSLDIPLGTVKSRIYFARKRLMHKLHDLN